MRQQGKILERNGIARSRFLYDLLAIEVKARRGAVEDDGHMLPLLRLAGRHGSLAGLGHGVHLHPTVHHIRSGGRSLEADPHTVVDISLAVVETDDHVVTGRELLFVHLELDGIGIEGDGRILHVQHHTVQFAGASGPVFAIEDRNGNDLLSLADDQEIGRIAQHLHTAAYTAQRHGQSVDRTRIIHLFGEGQDVDLRRCGSHFAGRNYDRIGRQFKTGFRQLYV